jgi:hypothetical protein
VIGFLVLVFLAVVGWSYLHALTLPGTDSLGAKSVEWLRGHGGSSLVRWGETEWYGHHKPPVAGMPHQGDLPRFPTPVAGEYGSTPTGVAVPHDVLPMVSGSSVPGEGHWLPVGRPVDSKPAVYATFLRPDPQHTRVVAGVAWMDMHLLQAVLYSGYQVPGGSGWTPAAPISAADGDLVAAFNSGFRLQDAAGSGYYSRGRTAAPIINGYASFVIYGNGTATVGQWGRDVTATPDIVSIRQNLNLIVDSGQPVPGLTDDRFQRWGATLGNKLYVWRSAVGVTADGALVYAGGKNLSIFTLAQLLAHCGAVRAMELDINTDWVNYFYFSPSPGGAAAPSNGSKLLPTMVSSAKRYFEPSSRDFIAMFAKPGAGATR